MDLCKKGKDRVRWRGGRKRREKKIVAIKSKIELYVFKGKNSVLLR